MMYSIINIRAENGEQTYAAYELPELPVFSDTDSRLDSIQKFKQTLAYTELGLYNESEAV